jgi:hypothetical protein
MRISFWAQPCHFRWNKAIITDDNYVWWGDYQICHDGVDPKSWKSLLLTRSPKRIHVLVVLHWRCSKEGSAWATGKVVFVGCQSCPIRAPSGAIWLTEPRMSHDLVNHAVEYWSMQSFFNVPYAQLVINDNSVSMTPSPFNESTVVLLFETNHKLLMFV